MGGDIYPELAEGQACPPLPACRQAGLEGSENLFLLQKPAYFLLERKYTSHLYYS